MATQDLADPYFELLGIPKEEHPPNRYRLLGIPLFTSNENVIRNAAARQMQFLRRVGGDKYLDEVQEILNEVAEARLLLLNPRKREEYDSKLRVEKHVTESAVDRIKEEESSQATLRHSILFLTGRFAGKGKSFSGDRILIGNTKECHLNLDGLADEFMIHRIQDQWVVESPLARFAINGILTEGRAYLKPGDVIRFHPELPVVQFVVGLADDPIEHWLKRYPDRRIGPPVAPRAPVAQIDPDPEIPEPPPRRQPKKNRFRKKKQSVSVTMLVFWLLVGAALAALIAVLIYTRS